MFRTPVDQFLMDRFDEPQLCACVRNLTGAAAGYSPLELPEGPAWGSPPCSQLPHGRWGRSQQMAHEGHSRWGEVVQESRREQGRKDSALSTSSEADAVRHLTQAAAVVEDVARSVPHNMEHVGAHIHIVCTYIYIYV